ncbi:hypothetical protein N7537_003016 [Penicillium hordei]|uniref:Glycine zipper 2TM domain-containing protein n=1 Tax=Penicillium hordei TaxID=40994 RepID=A0AAD6EIF3_9EURO|nr:uncharacterized protein N7537_003016 [Penicillium hordei]KAJ5617902.1 hypothetical protein N7537_003016 [Penicillium hordei]
MSYANGEIYGNSAEAGYFEQAHQQSSCLQQQNTYSGQQSSNVHEAPPPYTGTNLCQCGSIHPPAAPRVTQPPTSAPPYEPQQQRGENASYYDYDGPCQQAKAPHGFEGSDGEKGLGSTVVGSAAGGYAAHHMGGGKLATAGGALLGAVGMNVATHKFKQHQYQQQQPAQQPVQQTVIIPAQTNALGNGLGGGLGLGSGLGMGGGLGLGRVQRRLARRGIGMY